MIVAWTVLAGVIGAGFWVGQRTSSIDEIERRQDRSEVRVTALEARQSAVERDVAVIFTRLEEILRVVNRLDARFERMEVEIGDKLHVGSNN
jgi:chaperonin cofactor prefoldin